MPEFPKRYGVFIADLNPTIGSEIRKVRPVVIVSENDMNQRLATVVVCPLTTAIHPQWSTRLQVQCAGRTAETAVDQIRTVDKRRLGEQIDKLSLRDAAELRSIIRRMYAEP